MPPPPPRLLAVAPPEMLMVPPVEGVTPPETMKLFWLVNAKYPAEYWESPVATTLSGANGELVPIPTFPVLSTMKLVAEEEPITNAGAVPRLLASMESLPNGVVEPTPTFPDAVMRSFSEEVPALRVKKAKAPDSAPLV